MRFRRKNSVLSSIPEGSPRKRKILAVARFMYFAGMFLVLGYVLFYLFIHHYLYLFSTGYVEMEKYYIQSRQECEILEYYVKQNQEVNPSQPLVKIGSQLSNEASRRHLLEQRLELSHELKQNQDHLDILRQQLRQQEHDQQKAVLIDTIKKYDTNDYSPVGNDVRRLSLAKKEVQDMTLRIKLLEVERNQLLSKQGKLSNEEEMKNIFRYEEIIDSRFKGRVNRLNKQIYELAGRGETLLEIEDPQRIIIKAYFDPSFFNYLYENKPVSIRLPNNQKSKGIIKRIYGTNTALPSGTRGSSKIMVDIHPLDDNGNEWRAYNGMDATVIVTRSRR